MMPTPLLVIGRDYFLRKIMESYKTIAAIMFLCTTDRPDTGRHNRYAGNQACNPFFSDIGSIGTWHHACNNGAENRHGHSAYTEIDAYSLQFGNTQGDYTQTRCGEIIGLGFPKWISDGRCFGFRIIDLKHFPEFVFCPKAVLHSICDRIVAENNYCATILVRSSCSFIGHNEYFGPSKRKYFLRLSNIEYQAV